MTIDRPATRHRARGAAAAALTVALGLLGTSAVAATGPAPAPGAAGATGAATATYELTATPALATNPLKGFLPFAPEPGQSSGFADPDFPHSMEWFYLPVDSVVTGDGTYDWTAVESRLDAIAERGHQSVFRFYLDYPGQDSGVPDYLLGPDGISQDRAYDFFDNDGRSFSPDYDDPRVVDMIVDFVTAFGEEYDGDPRVGYVTAGLIGFWGEDHTYPVDGVVSDENPTGEDWMPSQATRETIWEAWDAALDDTWLLARYPSQAVKGHGFGLHDDSFAYATLPTTDWHFLTKVIEEGMQDTWQQAPIGGELYPPLQNCLFDDPLSCPDAAAEIPQGRDYNFADSVTQTHISWMMNHQAWSTGYTGATRERAVAAAASLGYDLAATQATVSSSGTTVDVALDLTNRGVAPFYYDWPASMVLLDAQGAVLAEAPVAANLPALQPGLTTTVSATLTAGDVDLTGATVAFTVPNVMDGGLPLRFANETQDADLEGYLSLGAVPAVAAPVVPEPVVPADPAPQAEAPGGSGAAVVPVAAVPAAAQASQGGDLAATGASATALGLVAAGGVALGSTVLLLRRRVLTAR